MIILPVAAADHPAQCGSMIGLNVLGRSFGAPAGHGCLWNFGRD